MVEEGRGGRADETGKVEIECDGTTKDEEAGSRWEGEVRQPRASKEAKDEGKPERRNALLGVMRTVQTH